MVELGRRSLGENRGHKSVDLLVKEREIVHGRIDGTVELYKRVIGEGAVRAVPLGP